MTRFLAILSLLLSCRAWSQPGTVVLRSGQTIEASDVVSTVDGVDCAVSGGHKVYGWHEVRAVTGEASGAASVYAELADDAWRGLARLNRHDRVAAEPLLERAFEQLAGRLGPTAQAVAEGLLRCQTARGAQAIALEPFLTLVLGNQVEVTSPILDPNTALLPSLPPIWGTDAGLATALTTIGANSFEKWGASGRARQFAELYATAAIFEINGEAPLTQFTPIDDATALLQEMVHARIGDERTRSISRQLLQERLQRESPAWKRAWIHSAIGLSLLEEGDDHSSRLGIVQLLYVPALYAEMQPYLAGVCLAEASVRLAEMGRGEAAVKLAGELNADYSTHATTENALIRELIRQYKEQSIPASPPEERL